MKYSNLFIDLDDTVFDSKSLYDQAIYISWEHFRKFYDIDYKEFKNAFLDIRKTLKSEYKHMTISHNRAILFEKLLEHFEIQFDADLIKDLYEVYWFSVNVYIQPFPNVIATLKTLKEKGVTILALSDGSLLSRLEKITSLKMTQYFDYLVSSEEVVYTKPEPQIFELAMKKIETDDKSQVLFVGNSFSTDVIGGEKYGIDTAWFNPENEQAPADSEYSPDFIIKDFTEILNIIN